MMLVGLAMIVASISWGMYAILPRNKGRRRRFLLRAVVCLLVFAMFYGTQASVLIPFFYEHWTPLLIVLFALPVVLLLSGLIASAAYGVIAVLRRAGQERRQMAMKSLLGVIIFGVGIAPHTLAMLMPIISYSDHANYPGTLTRVGDLAPDFQLAGIDGAPFQMDDLQGQVMVLNFFATWCGPCQDELPHLQAIWNEFRNDNHFRMLVVGREESEDTVKAFQQKNGFTFPMAADPNDSVYSKFASEHIPRTYLISGGRTVVYESTGYDEREIGRLKKLIRKELAKTK